MHTLLYELYAVIAIYLIIFILIFLQLARLSRKFQLHTVMPKWKRTAFIDAAFWPYYVIRYGVEGYWSEIR